MTYNCNIGEHFMTLILENERYICEHDIIIKYNDNITETRIVRNYLSHIYLPTILLPVRFLTLVPANMVEFSILVCVRTMVDSAGAGAKYNAVANTAKHHTW